VSFTWPLALLFVLAAPLVLGVYLLALRRRRRQAVTYSSLALLRSALPRRSRWRRHVPVAMLLASLGLLGVAAARPRLTSNVPIGRTSIILALDESRSMCSTDVQPNRLSVAQKAASEFVTSQPAGTRMGLVLFSASAQLAVPPTTDRAALEKVINNLSTGLGTAIGAAILKALDAVAEVNPQVQPVGDAATSGAASTTGSGATAGAAGPAAGAGQKPGTNGYVPDVIVLLTDGANTSGIAPLDAVPYAVARRVRVYTIGFGTTQPAPLVCSPQQLGGDTGQGGFGFGYGRGGFGGAFGGGFGGGFGGRSPLVADLPTLQQVAQRTGAAAYTAQDASQLSKVFANLPRDVTVQKERHEISSTFVALGALLAVAAVAASMRWSPYP
jgi:Ca-activated chloride channel family protein